MKFRVSHIPGLLALVLCVASCGRPKDVIKRDEMAVIIEDMILADYWVSLQSAEIRRQSDTTHFYEGIFNKYGYTLDDYLRSVDYYLNDPERFARIVKKTKASIEAKRNKLQAELDAKQEEGTDDSSASGSGGMAAPSDTVSDHVPFGTGPAKRKIELR